MDKAFSFLLLSSLLISFQVFANCQTACKAGFTHLNKDAFKGKALKPTDPIEGVNYITPEVASKHVKDSNWVFIDTRPKAAFFDKCKIRNAVPLEYAFPGHKDNKLTKESLKQFEGKTIVFYCNSFKCHRSTNAAIQSRLWGFPKGKVKWLGDGVPGMVKKLKKYRKYVTGKGCPTFRK